MVQTDKSVETCSVENVSTTFKRGAMINRGARTVSCKKEPFQRFTRP